MGLLDIVGGMLSGQGGAAGAGGSGDLAVQLGRGGQGSPGGGQAELLRMILAMLASDGRGGGLAELMQKFQAAGMGDQVNSWVGSGQNLPVSAEQLQAVLGGGQLQNIAAQLGVSPEQASGSLAELLPQVVDKLTPDGQLPQGGELLAQGMDLLKKGGLFG